MSYSRIQAVDVVRLLGEPHHADALRWFYCKIAGLEDATQPEPGDRQPADFDAIREGKQRDPGESASPKSAVEYAELRFRSGKIDLSVRLTPAQAAGPIPYRVTIGVADLDAVMARLDERRLPYQRFCGLSFSDRRIGLLDPAGNRIFLKQDWPDM